MFSLISGKKLRSVKTVEPVVSAHLKCEELVVAYLREVVAYESRTAGCLLRGEFRAYLLLGDNAVFCKLIINYTSM